MSDYLPPLPAGWMEIKDSATGQTLYFNKQVRFFHITIRILDWHHVEWKTWDIQDPCPLEV